MCKPYILACQLPWMERCTIRAVKTQRHALARALRPHAPLCRRLAWPLGNVGDGGCDVHHSRPNPFRLLPAIYTLQSAAVQSLGAATRQKQRVLGSWRSKTNSNANIRVQYTILRTPTVLPSCPRKPSRPGMSKGERRKRYMLTHSQLPSLTSPR